MAPGNAIRVQGWVWVWREWHELALPWEPSLKGTLSKPLMWGGYGRGWDEGDRGE